MQLSDEQVRSFIDAWKRAFGATLAPDEARKIATRLLLLVDQYAEYLTRQAHLAGTPAPGYREDTPHDNVPPP